jgi:HK97 gp10 family phage protein
MKAFLETDVKGVKELERQLRELPRRVSKKVTRKAVDMGARIVSRDAKRLARRGKTKLLAKSIGVRGKQGKNGYSTKIGSRRGFAVTDSGGKKLYDPTRIVHLVEKGTKAHAIPRRGLLGKKVKKRQAIAHPGAQPYPFIRPALDNNIGQVQNTIRAKLWSGIQEEAAKQ